MNWYEDKRAFHLEQWEKAKENNEPTAAKYHMNEYVNYSEMCNQEVTNDVSSTTHE